MSIRRASCSAFALVSAVVVAVGACASPSDDATGSAPCDANPELSLGARAIASNGQNLNGDNLNGSALNGQSLNGILVNGSSLNGQNLNGQNLNGLI